MRTETDRDGRVITYDDDGRCLSVKVPAFMRDNQPPPAGPLHRPGSLPLTDAQRQQMATPYLAHRQAISEAWRNPTPLPPEMTADGPPQASTPTTADQAYEERNRRLADAWRRPSGPASLPQRRRP